MVLWFPSMDGLEVRVNGTADWGDEPIPMDFQPAISVPLTGERLSLVTARLREHPRRTCLTLRLKIGSPDVATIDHIDQTALGGPPVPRDPSAKVPVCVVRGLA